MYKDIDIYVDVYIYIYIWEISLPTLTIKSALDVSWTAPEGMPGA